MASPYFRWVDAPLLHGSLKLGQQCWSTSIKLVAYRFVFNRFSAALVLHDARAPWSGSIAAVMEASGDEGGGDGEAFRREVMGRRKETCVTCCLCSR
jgi:hypothetical protein